jgi:D-sedoheptulose 7-phosphate isomerase
MSNMLKSNIETVQTLLNELVALADPLEQAASLIRDALLAGRTVMCCGNGGSAADCAHLSAELAGRYDIERRGYCAIDLTANHSLITALINDYPAAEVFARQIQAIGHAGDVLVAISTSGKSENVRLAIQAANDKGLHTIALLGKGGGVCKGLATVEIIAPSDVTARVQEAHLFLYHNICEAIDQALADGGA